MKAVPFLLLALGAAFASACHNYDSCQCVGSDGTANDTATANVCNAVGGSGTSLCYSGEDMDNCHWKDFCALAGATGSDSSCFRD
jgi:hypothetical protein